MKQLFLILLIVMVSASFAIWYSLPGAQSDVPVIYWVTDPNPARVKQVELFHEWLVENGHTTAEGEPITELRVDAANRETAKKVIQGVSGVGGDIMDLWSGQTVRFFHAIGLLRDVTEAGRQYGFSTDQTYPALENELTVDGVQYAFPCNVTCQMYWVNNATLRKYGVESLPKRWTFEEFERIGKQVVDAANPPGERRTVWFASNVRIEAMHRSLGLSIFNETLTECTVDDERFIECLRLIDKWTNEDHILPSAADRLSMDTAAGYGGSNPQLFNNGNLVMFASGRYALIQLRKFNETRAESGQPLLEMSVVEHPHAGMPNTNIGTRCAGVYVGGDHPELAELFLAFLASEKYNMQIVDDADALPPNPKYTQTEAFTAPADYPNEAGLHEPFAEAARTIAIGGVYSPFVLYTEASRHLRDAEQAVLADRMTPEEAAKEAAYRINQQIKRTIEEQPKLKPRYDELVERQKAIDELRASGKPVPVEMIENEFYRRYYRFKGWLVE